MQEQKVDALGHNSAGTLSDDQQSLWKKRLLRSKQHHGRYWDVAQRIRNEYLGKHDAQSDMPSEAGKPLNLISSFIHTVLPLVSPRDSWPMVEPKLPGDEYVEGARRLEARLREVFDTVGARKNFARAMFDAFFLAGFVHVGWMPKASQAVAGVDSLAGGPDKSQPEARDPGSAGDDSGDSQLSSDEVLFRHIDYRDIRIDPDAASVDEARWIGYVMERPVADVKADDKARNPMGIYRDTDQIRDGGDDRPAAVAGTSDQGDMPEQDKMVTLYTLYQPGRREGEVEIIVLAGPQYVPIRREYLTLGIRGLPIRCLTLHDVGRLFPAVPEQFWLDQLTAMNEFLKEATERARQSKVVALVADTTDDLAGKIQSARGGDVINTPDPSRANTLTLGGVHPATMDLLATAERMTDKVSGIADFQRGISSNVARTAREVEAMDTYTKGRLDMYTSHMNDWLEQLVVDGASMLLQFQWQPSPVRIEEGGGKYRWSDFSNQEVPANVLGYQFQIDISQQQRNSPALKEKRAQDRLEILARPDIQQAAAAVGKRLNIVAALEDLLEASGTRDIGRYVEDLPDPTQQQQQAADEENQDMLSGIPREVSMEGDDHRIHARAHLPVADQSPLVAEHLAEHFAYLGGQRSGQSPGADAVHAPGGIPSAPPISDASGPNMAAGPMVGTQAPSAANEYAQATSLF